MLMEMGGAIERRGEKKMNNVVLMGRLVRDPETRYSQSGTGVSRYTLAVDRRFKRDGEPTADYINCVAFGKGAEFAEKYLRKGMRMCVSGHIQTGSYTNKDGVKVYTTEVIVDSQEFCESKGKAEKDDFVAVPDGIEEEVPFA